jgi:hypothetical protein
MAEQDPLSRILHDLALLGRAVRSARFRLENGAQATPQLVQALRAGERAQAGLVDLLLEARGRREVQHRVLSARGAAGRGHGS